MKLKIRSLFAILYYLTIIKAALIHIPADQPTIQQGVDAAIDGDTVLVNPGVYVENVQLSSKNIVLASLFLITNDSSYIQQTIIDGNNNNSVILSSSQDSTALISGFTLTGGSSSFGGGIFFLGSDPKVENMIITNNTANHGGGVACTMANPLITNAVISSNSAPTGSGGGIMCDFNSSPHLENVTIHNNIALWGGGLFCSNFSDPRLKNVTISNNTATVNGGGIHVGIYSDVNILNSISWNDSPEEIFLENLTPPSSITVRYADILGGAGGIVANGGTVNWLEGNIDTNPLFCDPASGIYTLAENSPCLGTGLDGNNMGAFGLGCDSLVNVAPVIMDIPDQTINEDETLELTLTATDGDSDPSLLVFSAYSDTTAVSTIISQNNHLTVEPDTNWFGQATILVTVFDGEYFDSTTFILTVNPVNDPPSAVTLLYPSSIVIATLTPQFQWTVAYDPDPLDSITYEMHWWEAGHDILDSVIVDTNTYLIPTPLNDNAAYYWQVISIDLNYDLSHSENAVFWTDTYPEPPTAFNTISPTDSAEGLSTEVEFVWQKSHDPDPVDHITYTLVYATDWSDSSHYHIVDGITDTTVSLTLEDNTKYWWLIRAMDEDSLVTISNDNWPQSFIVGTLGIDNNATLKEFTLSLNYPNPFNTRTKFKISIPREEQVRLAIHDLSGREVAVLINGVLPPGNKEINWEASNMASGIYFYRLETPEGVITHKMTVMK